MQISTEEALQALRQIEASRLSFRRAIGASRGYQHLWLWGTIWIGYSMLCEFLTTPRLGPATGWLSLSGFLGSTLIGWRQSRRVRTPVDPRFLGALAVVVGFGVFVWPLLLGRASGHAIFAYPALIAMQAYIVAGLWYDNHLLWVGLLTTALLLVGYLFFGAYFWWWAAIFGGGTLIASGFYVRSAWR